MKGESVPVAWTLHIGVPATARPTDDWSPQNLAPFISSDEVDVSSVRHTKLIFVLALTRMTARVRCDAIGLSSFDPRSSIAARHGIRMTNSVAELDAGKKFDVIGEIFTRLDGTLPKITVVSYAKRNFLAPITPSRATSKQYRRVLHTPATASPDAPLILPSWLSGKDGAPGSATPPPWQDYLDLRHNPDTDLRAQLFNTLHKHASIWSGNLQTIKATEPD